MNWIACALLACAACQHGDAGSSSEPPPAGAARAPGQAAHAPAPAAAPVTPRPALTPEYRKDITTLCDVIHLSGADQLPEAERWPAIAMWLGPHIATEEGRGFLVAIQPLTGEPKAQALDAEAHRVGLATCALSAEWRR